MTKPKVGFYAITGCQGCLLSVIFNEEDILDIYYSLLAITFNKQNKDGMAISYADRARKRLRKYPSNDPVRKLFLPTVSKNS